MTTQNYILTYDQVIITDLQWSIANQIATAIFNNFDGLKVNIITWSNDRDVTKYYIKPESKVTKPQLRDLQMFAKGMVVAFR